MDIQKPYSRDFPQNYSFPVTEHFEYSSITSVFDTLLSIDSFIKSLTSTDPHTIKLTFKVKKLAQSFKSSADPYSSFFSYLPPVFKNDLSPAEVLSIFLEDFNSESSDFQIVVVPISVSNLLAHTGRPQEVFEKALNEGKPKLIVFDLNWDTEVTMEKVIKVIKCVPGNIQVQGFMEIASVVACTSTYYSAIVKNQENWKNFEKFGDKEGMSWVKVAWMLLSGLKYPNLLVFQRVDGYKSSANFITSLDFENLLKFAKKQDEKVVIRPRNSEKSKTTENRLIENPNPYENKYSRPVLETKDVYPRPEVSYPYSLESKKISASESPQIDDFSRKSQTPIHRKYEGLDSKSGSFDNRLNLAPANERVLRPSKFDIPKAPLRRDDKNLERAYENFEKPTSPKNKEESFRSWDKNEEMERIHLGSPKDRDFKALRPSSRQEELYSKLSYTPQRNMGREPEKVLHYSPKESEEKFQSSSPYFKERHSYKDTYQEMIDSRKNREGLREDFPSNKYEFRENAEEKFQRDKVGKEDFRGFSENNQEFHLDLGQNYEENFRRDFKFDKNPIKDYSVPEPSYLKKQDSFSNKFSKPVYESFERDEKTSGKSGLGNYYKKEESFDPTAEKFNYKEYRDSEENKQSDNKFLEEFYQRKDKFRNNEETYENKPRENLENFEINKNERFRTRDFKYSSEDQLEDNEKISFPKESEEAEDFDNYKFDFKDRLRLRNSKFDEESEGKSELKGELKAKDLALNEQDEGPKDFKFRDEEPRAYKFRDFGQEAPNQPPSEDTLSRKYQSLATKELYEKYLPKAKEENLEENTEFKPRSEYLLKKPEDFMGKYRDFKRPEERTAEDTSFKGQNLEIYSSNDEKSGLYGNYKRNERNFEEDPKKNEYEFEKNLGEAGKNQENFSRNSIGNEFSEWNCAKCNKKVPGNSYECSDCRLINWDQFYKVKSLQHNRNKTEENPVNKEIGIKDENVRRLYSFSDNKDENSEWVCLNCKTSNKHLFFLCKSCRKPRNTSREPANNENQRKEYKFSN